MSCCEPGCPEEKEASENVRVIRRNVEDFLWKVQDLDSVEAQEKYCVALFNKLWSISSISDLANMTIDMSAQLQKIKLKKENEEENMEDKMEWDVFIELFNTNDKEAD